MRAPRSSQPTSNWGGSQRTRRKAVQILTALIVGVGTLATSAVPALASLSTPARPVRGDLESTTTILGDVRDDDEFETLLLWYLLWLYEILGGDPATLTDLPPDQVMASVATFYQKHGVPQGLTASEQTEFRSAIEQTAALLDEIAPAPPSITTFRSTLNSMYAAVGGDPDTLP